jgi:hypothetical protein
MALVRRSTIIGQLDHAISAGVTDASDMLVKQVSAAARDAAPVQSNGGSSNGGSEPTVNLSPASKAASAVPAWAANAEAAAVASKGASVLSVLGAFLIVAVGTGAAYGLNHWVHKSTPFEIGNQVSAYAAIVVFAGAVERLLEPFSNLLPGNGARARYESVVAALANGHPTTTLKDVAAAKAKLDHALSNRTVLMWGMATGLAALVSGLGGFYLLHMIAASDWTVDLPYWVDAMVTGLVVGTGTKPLHDLITRAQESRS